MLNFVGSFVPGKASGGANVGTSLETITKGDILVVDYYSGAVLTGTGNTVSTSPVIQIAYCIEDGVPILSGPIYGRSLKGGGRNNYVAPVQKVAGFGYTSVSTGDALPVFTEKTEFSGSIVFPTDLRLVPNRQDRIDFNVYSKGGYDLGALIAMDINRYSDLNPQITGKKYVQAQVESDGTKSNIGTSATASVGEFKKTVKFSSAHGLSVGNVVWFPNGGTYKVSVVTSTTVIELDYPYQGKTEVYAADTAKSVATAANFGVIVTALPITRKNPVDKYSQVNFSIGLSDAFGDLSEKIITAYVKGKGTGWQLRDYEVAHLGWNGYSDRRDTMRPEYPFQTDVNLNYNVVSIDSIAPVRGDLQQTNDGPVSVSMAFSTTAATQINAVMAILEPWAASGGLDIT